MRPEILILGQGIAGTLLAWEFERAGIAFQIGDPQPERAATLTGAGIINPITGRRLVKSWRVDTLLPAVRTTYQEFGDVLGVPVWHDMRVRRFFADAGERAACAAKQASGEFGDLAGPSDDAGFWIERAGWVDMPALLAAARAHWQRTGRWRDEVGLPVEEAARHDLVIDCTGLCAARGAEWAFLPFEFSKGELLEIELLPDVPASEPGVILNNRHWLLPVGERRAWTGSTHEPILASSLAEVQPSPAARLRLETAATELFRLHDQAPRPFAVTGQRAGLRVTTPDKLPVAGRHPSLPHLGLVNGLGAKGALFAPMLARQWVNHLTEGVPFAAAVTVSRFGSRAL